MSDVRRFVRIDAGVLDHELAGFGRIGRPGDFGQPGYQCGPIKEDVQVSGAGNFHSAHLFGCFQFGFERFRDGSWRTFLSGLLLNLFRQFESNGKGKVTELSTRWDFCRNLFEFDVEQF